MAASFDNRPQARIQKLRNEQDQIRPGPNGKFSKKDKKRMVQIILEIKKIEKEIIASQRGTSTPTQTQTPTQTPVPVNEKKKSGGGLDFKRIAGGIADFATLGMFDFDNKNRKGAPKDFGIRRIVGGLEIGRAHV